MLIVSCADAQKVKEGDVPKAVITSLQNNFKNVKVGEWEKENGNYEAEFDYNKVETSALFSADGKLLETEQEISKSALPKSISDYISKNYADYKVSEAAKITDDKGTLTYEAEVSKGKEKMDLIFDAAGNFVKKTIESKEDKD